MLPNTWTKEPSGIPGAPPGGSSAYTGFCRALSRTFASRNAPLMSPKFIVHLFDTSICRIKLLPNWGLVSDTFLPTPSEPNQDHDDLEDTTLILDSPSSCFFGDYKSTGHNPIWFLCSDSLGLGRQHYPDCFLLISQGGPLNNFWLIDLFLKGRRIFEQRSSLAIFFLRQLAISISSGWDELSASMHKSASSTLAHLLGGSTLDSRDWFRLVPCTSSRIPRKSSAWVAWGLNHNMSGPFWFIHSLTGPYELFLTPWLLSPGLTVDVLGKGSLLDSSSGFGSAESLAAGILDSGFTSGLVASAGPGAPCAPWTEILPSRAAVGFPCAESSALKRSDGQLDPRNPPHRLLSNLQRKFLTTGSSCSGMKAVVRADLWIRQQATSLNPMILQQSRMRNDMLGWPHFGTTLLSEIYKLVS